MRDVGDRLLLAALMVGAAACANAQAAAPASARSHPWSGNGTVGGQWVSGSYGSVGFTVQHGLDYAGPAVQGNLSTTFGYQLTTVEGQSVNGAGQPVASTHQLRTENYGAELRARVPSSGPRFGVLHASWTRAPSQGLNARLVSTAGAGIRFGSSRRQVTVELAGGRAIEHQLDGHQVTFGTAAISFSVQQSWGAGGSLTGATDLIQNLGTSADALAVGNYSISAPLVRGVALTLAYAFTWDGLPSAAAFDPTGQDDGIDFSVLPTKYAGTLSAGLSINWR